MQGAVATTEDRAACAGLVVSKDAEMGGNAVQMRVVMNKEPRHFLKIFGGKIIIFMVNIIDKCFLIS